MSVPVPPGLYTEPSRGAPAFLPAPTPQAADPTVLSTGQVIPRQAMPTADVGNSFSVDLATAPQVLRELRQARDQLQELRHDALFLGKIDPETHDEVSRDAAVVFGAIAVGGQGSLLDALDGGVQRLDGLIAAVESELALYRSADLAQADRFDANA
ncbi:hypothetical protein [Actinomycetospora chiangmaiensis]|uniref:hypothetical protein n=1 Tax=Actinomycetospora chiangmaiensis TaxID=402650 RepID=UPI00037C4A75|nr:hypothetical protein [Actinomycetospora chiangmaiensis]